MTGCQFHISLTVEVHCATAAHFFFTLCDSPLQRVGVFHCLVVMILVIHDRDILRRLAKLIQYFEEIVHNFFFIVTKHTGVVVEFGEVFFKCASVDETSQQDVGVL